jgi:Spy/CpxP family protein refolding chaperone
MKYILLLASLFIASLGVAQPMHHGRTGPGRERMIDKLDLKADQAKQVETLTSALEKKQIAVRSKILALRVDLRGLMGEENPSKTDIQTLQGQINALRGELQANRTDFWFDVNKILTPDQRKEWKHRLWAAPAEGKRKPPMGRWNRHLGM